VLRQRVTVPPLDDVGVPQSAALHLQSAAFEREISLFADTRRKRRFSSSFWRPLLGIAVRVEIGRAKSGLCAKGSVRGLSELRTGRASWGLWRDGGSADGY
jgi:hypothetical protein